MASLYFSLFVGVFLFESKILNYIFFRDWADFNIPAAFSPKVRNALKAEAKSVRLSNLVGAGGLWYGFGKTITDM
jgi:GINS complex subunit 3